MDKIYSFFNANIIIAKRWNISKFISFILHVIKKINNKIFNFTMWILSHVCVDHHHQSFCGFSNLSKMSYVIKKIICMYVYAKIENRNGQCFKRTTIIKLKITIYTRNYQLNSHIRFARSLRSTSAKYQIYLIANVKCTFFSALRFTTV